MKNLLTLLICLLTLNVFAQDGTLDSTFGVNGMVATNSNIIPGKVCYFNKFGVLQNGSIIRAGTIGYDSSILLSCLKPNGTLEYNFGSSTYGYLVLSDSLFRTATQDLLITNNNKILIAALNYQAANTNIFLLKLNADGTFDNTFGTNGRAKIPANIKTIKQLLVQQNGGILVHADTFLYRFTPTGGIDPTFGTAGKLSVGIYANTIAVTPNDKIYVSSSYRSISIKRYHPNGLIDTAFGNNGEYLYYVSSLPGAPYETYSKLAIQSDSLDNFKFAYYKFDRYNNGIDQGVNRQYIVFKRMLNQGNLDTSYTFSFTNGNGGTVTLINARLDLLYQSNGKDITIEQNYAYPLYPSSIKVSRWYQNKRLAKDISYTSVNLDEQYMTLESSILYNDSSVYLLGTSSPSSGPKVSKLIKIKTSLNNYQPHIPVAKIWVDKNTGNTSTSFSFRDSSAHGPLQTKWEFTPNNVVYISGYNSTSTNPKVRFTQNGKYTVKLVVSNLMGADTIVQSQFIEINDKPIARFGISNNVTIPTVKIYLTDSSLNSPTKWKWVFTQPNVVFEMGTSDTSQNPVVRFTQAGFYNIKLTVTSPFGTDSIIKQNVITALNSSLPIANFSASKTYALSGTPIQLLNKSAYAQQVKQWYISPSVGYTYISGDSTSDYPILKFDSIGNYSVALAVTNNWGIDSLMKTDFIHIGNQKVSAFFTAPKTNATTLDTIVLLDSCINATNRVWKITPNTYTLISDSTILFNSDGLYTVQLIASNLFDADTSTKINYLNINTPLPQALFYVDKTGGYVGDTITLIDTSLFAANRQWQVSPATYTKSGNIILPTFYTLNWDPKILVFTKNGVYSIKLNVSNSNGTSELLRTNYITITSVGLDEALQNNAEVTLYPNPAQNQLTVVCNVAQIQAINLLDISGKMLHTFTNNTTINISQCASGMYLVKIETDKGTVVKKLIISK